jgi:hypothetical protein
MIQIITDILNENEQDDLDVLATSCDYEVTLSVMSDGSINSALCEGKNAGELARDIIDEHYLLRDDSIPFPITQSAIYKICEWFVPAKIGV